MLLQARQAVASVSYSLAPVFGRGVTNGCCCSLW